MKENIVLRDKIDFQDFQILHKELGWKILDDKVVKESLKNSTFQVVALDGERAVGMARVVGDGISHGLLTDVVVLPEYQHQGIGKALVEYLIDKCQQVANENDEFLIELLPTAGNAEFYEKCGLKHLPDKMEGCYVWLKNQNIYIKGAKKYVLHLHEEPFELIKSGKKTIEMRLFDEKREVYKVGDILIFVNRLKKWECIKTKIVALHKFSSFEELYASLDKVKLGYKKDEVASPNDMRKYYSPENEKKYGVVGIEIEILKG